LIVVTPVSRIASLPLAVAGGAEKLTFSATGRVTPRAVRLPRTTPLVELIIDRSVPSKRTVGYLATWKKSSPFNRLVVRLSSALSWVASIDTSRLIRSIVPGDSATLPRKTGNCALRLPMPMNATLASTELAPESIVKL
jgi:hypothetical protein